MCFWREPPTRIPKRPEVFPLASLKRGIRQALPVGSSALGIAGPERETSTCPQLQLSTSPEATSNTRSWIFLMQGRWLVSSSSSFFRHSLFCLLNEIQLFKGREGQRWQPRKLPGEELIHKTSRHNPSVAPFPRNIPRISACSQASGDFPLREEMKAIPQKQGCRMVKNWCLAWLSASPCNSQSL